MTNTQDNFCEFTYNHHMNWPCNRVSCHRRWCHSVAAMTRIRW